jgi:hypothetical protein
MRFVIMWAVLSADEILRDKFNLASPKEGTQSFFAGLTWFLLLLDIIEIAAAWK